MESFSGTPYEPQHQHQPMLVNDRIQIPRASSGGTSNERLTDEWVGCKRLGAVSALSEGKLSTRPLTADDLKLAANVLFTAYFHDPLFTSVFRASEEGYEMRLRTAIQQELTVFFKTGQLVMGLFSGNCLLAVACLIRPNTELRPERSWHWRLNMVLTVGTFTTRQLIVAEQAVRAGVHHERYYLLSMIGVNPHYQGKGLGKRLMSTVLSLVSGSPESSGIALSVRLPAYRAFFEKQGFALQQQMISGAISGDVMFWPSTAA